MKKIIITIFVGFFLCYQPANTVKVPNCSATEVSQIKTKIRILILKHSKESIADTDANLAISAVNKAAAKGLNIEVIGNHFINKEGKSLICVWEHGYNLPKLKEFVSQQMKNNAHPGDTLILFTIGHGMPSGDLHNLGQRSEVMKVIVDAAEENGQKVFWWQLSCHACARLPLISTLTARQQRLFSMLASSTAEDTSGVGIQGRLMEKVFMAMAEDSRELDANGDGTITLGELSNFMNKHCRSKSGDLIFGQNPNYPVFGKSFLQMIPIVDVKDPQKSYDDNYIPTP